MTLNPSEGTIISNFAKVCYAHRFEEMTLYYSDEDFIFAKFEYEMEDENDYDENDPRYEEFYSYVFTVIEIHGNPPVKPYDDTITINYHNFPKKIICGENILN